MSAVEMFTSTAQGTAITFETAPVGSATRRAVVAFQANGCLNLVPMASAPSSPVAGDIYFNSTIGQFMGRTASAWVVLG